MIRLTFVILAAINLSYCSYFSKPANDQNLNITDTDSELSPVATANINESSKIIDYTFKNKRFKSEYFLCTSKSAKYTVMVMQTEDEPFTPNSSCQHWAVRSFANENYNVIAINRPGYGKSNGKRDFAGAQSSAAINAAIKDIYSKNKTLPQIIGAWGYSIGATAAALFAKNHKGLQWLIIGGGIYDLEKSLNYSRNRQLREKVQALARISFSELEVRSISYDIEGLPHNVYIYHGKKDRTVFPRQAEELRDSLLALEHNVHLQIIKGLKHNIKPRYHAQILKVLIKAVTPIKPYRRQK